MSRTSFRLASLVCAAVAVTAPASAGEPTAIPMTPGKGLSLDVGTKHTMTYFDQKDGACRLTVVIAGVEGGVKGDDTPGTRITATVMPGTALRVDAAGDKSAEFLCGPEGRQMNARVFDREGYAKDKRS